MAKTSMAMTGRRETLLEMCCLMLLMTGSGQSADTRQTQHLLSYQLTTPRPIGGRPRRDADGSLPNQVSFAIGVSGRQHVVRLERNRMLLPDDFKVFTYADNGRIISSVPDVKNHCHYQGFVEGMEGSSVAMSICHGLRGVMHLDEDSYAIEPLDSAPEQHLLYRLRDVTSQPRGCGTPHRYSERNRTEHAYSQGWQQQEVHQHARAKRDVFHRTHYVELLLVVDNDRYNTMNRNNSAVVEEMVHLANFIDSIYVQLNVRVVLVGLEIWTRQNLISTEGGAGEVLSRFTQWREKELLPRRRHDSAQLILKKSFGVTAGMAYVSTVCSRSHGGGINAFTNNNVFAFASIVAHELGHNLGMNHDDGRTCACPVQACIMNSGATGSRNFSSCSADDFEKMLLITGASCLLNVPHPDEAYNVPSCGNGLQDVGEECDCGSRQECERDPCCEFKTCRLKPGAECADGECCYNCRFKAGGTVCRANTDECDLPEYCNGSSSLCQSDVFVQNGQECRNGQAYCYNGRCRHAGDQCRSIFGAKAKVAPEICFKDVNSKGDRFGNCGYQNYGYKKCESRNALCGKLQCANVQGVKAFGVEPSIITTPIGGAVCSGVDFMLGSDVPDPGMVNEGTKCGRDKVCLNFECQNVNVLNFDCDARNRCHGHGVCNNNRNCHCQAGWAPPFCELAGYGGSVDSGPTWNDKDTSLRDGLLVFFFVLVPLAAMGALAFVRRKQLLRRLGLGSQRRPQAYRPDVPAPPDRGRGPPPVARPPPVGRAGDPSGDVLTQSETSWSATSYATRPPPPPPMKAKAGSAAQPLMPQRAAPPPPPV
ncbi:disintegrin and metalloproteinase domain-containing protein 9-like isoform X1 [Corythoichthys intestinalis]|uniref:disintegrin and metalloproteinase domain-containing protein 9-like isoform X1 n=1 Tax=Corythoichthys intestinalis TaxID=161448 RepID=UPI0025A53371|nr:disintegrin and metalloproteinase domain-containing protein 9-like isoform X1 [Corythoichthys intestinalis]